MAAVSQDADTEKQKPSVTSQIAVGVVVALLAGGTAPWWYEKLLGASAPSKEAPASNAVDSLAEHPAISRSVVVGRWEFEQVIGKASIRSSFDFLPDGTFSGYLATFVGGGGRKDQVQGVWNIAPISNDTFNLTLDYSVKPPEIPDRVEAKYKLIDRDHSQNIDQNFVANRVQ
jgi:hypothetical protein